MSSEQEHPPMARPKVWYCHACDTPYFVGSGGTTEKWCAECAEIAGQEE